MENEKFKSWGAEDEELFYRFYTLGYKIHRLEGDMIHLNHARTSIEEHNKHSRMQNNRDEKIKISKMKNKELREYISTWSWI